MISILFINHSNELGGAERSLLAILEGLNKTRFKPILLTFGKGPLSDRAAGMGAEVIRLTDIGGIERFRRDRLVRGLLGGACRLPALVRQVLRIRRVLSEKTIDIVHTNNPKSHVLGALAAIGLRKRLVFHMRDIFARGTLAYRLFSLLGALARPRCITVSHSVRNHLPESLKNRAQVIYNGFRPARGLVSRQEVRRSFSIPEQAKVIVSAGRLVPWKGFDLLIRAASPFLKKKECYLVILGKTLYWDEGTLDELVSLAASLSVSDHVLFPGHLEDVMSVMAASDLFVLPSENEPFGRALVEGMLCGLPVIAFRQAGPLEIVEDGVTGVLVTERTPEALRHAMGSLFSDAEGSRRMGERAKAAAESRFALDRMIAELERFYSEVPGK